MSLPVDSSPERRGPDLLLFALFLAASAALLALPEPREAELTGFLRATVLAPVLAAHDWYRERTELREQVDELRRRRDSLERELARRSGLEEENALLRALLRVEDRDVGEFLPAQITLGSPRTGEPHRFVVGVGRRRGVRTPAGVIAPDGVVGVVRSADGERAVGDLWTHPEFRLSVRSDSLRATGIVRPLREDDGRTVMLFEGAPYQRELAPGTALVTTGAGGVYPPGVPVGTVQAVASVESGWARSYRVRPAVRPEQVRFVLVWRPPRPAAAGRAGER